MPTRRIDYVDQPYAGKRHTPDTSRLALLYTRLGDALAETAMRKGEIQQRGFENLAGLFSNFTGQRRAAKVAEAATAQRERERAVDAAEREKDRAFRADQDRIARQARATEVYEARRANEDAQLREQAQRDQEMGGIREQVKALGGVLGPNGQIIMPPKPEREPNPTEATLAMRAAAGDKVAARALELMRVRPESTASEPLMPIVGPDGKTRYGTRAEARGQVVPSSQNKPATGLEKRALNFFNRAEQADQDLEKIEDQITKLSLGAQARMEYAPNFLQSQLGQSYLQAQRAFTEARLRKDSGAAIPEQEFANDRRTYFAQPGDSPETLAQKRASRAAILASLGFESGQALGEFLGDADEARRVVTAYRDRSNKKATVDEVPNGQLEPGTSVTIGGFTVTRKQ